MINEGNSPKLGDFSSRADAYERQAEPGDDSGLYGQAPCLPVGLSPALRAGEIASLDSGRERTPAAAIPSALEWLFNATVALILIVLTLPVFCFVLLLIFVVDGPPVFYLGRRLGRHMRPFTMIKFRTLQNESSTALGGKILPHDHELAIPCGKFLRETRLDELPQLLNIVRGDMNLFGPRPERDEVYESLCRHLNGYHRRFAVKPGLVGVSQLFTPHSAPRRLRVFIDNRVLQEKSGLRKMLYVGLAALTVAGSTATWFYRQIAQFLQGVTARGWNMRRFRRRRPRKAKVRFERIDGGFRPSNGNHAGSLEPLELPIVDINEEALCFHSPHRLADLGANLRLDLTVRIRRRFRPSASRIRTASGTARIVQVRRTASGWNHVVNYVAASEMSRYIIHQYLLGDSLRPPFRP